MKGDPVSRVDAFRQLVPYHHVRYEAACNLGCFYCYERPHRRHDPDETLAAVAESLRFARDAGYRVVVFGAGELLLCERWPEAVELASRLGFDEVVLLTNLTLLDRAKLDRLVAAGLTGLAGTFAALSDRDGRQVAGAKQVYSRQLEAARLLAEYPDLIFRLHLIMTGEVAADPLGGLLELRDAMGLEMPVAMVSAIEPVSDEVRRHPHYRHGLDLEWPGLIRRAGGEGIMLLVQNIPACLLGEYAHRSLVLRRRVARVLAGWPGQPELSRQVDRTETLYRRLAPAGACLGCPLLGVCHRFFEYPRVARPEGARAEAVVAALLAEEGLEGDPAQIVDMLERIESRGAPAGRQA